MQNYNIYIRFDLIPKNNRYRNKNHKDACEGIENHMQKLDTVHEVFLGWISKTEENLTTADKICMQHKTLKETIKESYKEVCNTVIKINKLRKFLTEPYTPKLALGFIKRHEILPYYYKRTPPALAVRVG